MADSQAVDVLGRTLVEFARDGVFPEQDEVSAQYVDGSAFPAALSTLAAAKLDLENEVRRISAQSAPDVDAWVKQAQQLQEDTERAKAAALDISRRADVGDSIAATLKDSQQHFAFLTGELEYNSQVSSALKAIKDVHKLIETAQQEAANRDILTALWTLDKAWAALDQSEYQLSDVRAFRLLKQRALALQNAVHEDFDTIWRTLVNVDVEHGKLSILGRLEDSHITLADAVSIAAAFGDLNKRIESFCEQLKAAIITPRTQLNSGNTPSIEIENDTITRSAATADLTVKSLLYDLEQISMFINQRLPAEFTVPLSEHLMPNLVAEIKATWLDSAVPVSINDMVEYRKAIALVDSLAASLASMNWAGSEEMQDWVASAPKIWLAKRRETSLDWVRNQLALGIGITKEVERTETQEISRSEGQHIPREVNSGTNDWNSAWSDGGHDDGNNGEAGSSSPRLVSKVATNTDAPVSVSVPAQDDGLEDDAADAWGWGDEDDTAETQPESHTDDMDEESNEPPPNLQQSQISVRQVTLTEKYRISSMPGSVLDTVTSILEDAVTLTKDEHADNPVSAAAAGLFSLPTLVLAIYRAVSPAYYQESDWGNMYLYNDALWLAEQLQTLSSAWSSRDDLPSRAHGKIRLDSEVLGLETFGKRAYAQEMTTQKTILHDLLGGSQNFLQRDGHVPSADDDEIEGVVARIQSISADWKRVLTKSAWAQAMGSLLSSMARKIILDVQELTALGADEAYRAAGLITKMLKLDELFLPDDQAQAQIPTTSKYAPHWLKLQFLNEVLQSDLKDVMFLWLESDLSLYFSAEEVVDLIEASFEDNPRRRVAISRIKNEPNPKGVGAEDA